MSGRTPLPLGLHRQQRLLLRRARPHTVGRQLRQQLPVLPRRDQVRRGVKELLARRGQPRQAEAAPLGRHGHLPADVRQHDHHVAVIVLLRLLQALVAGAADGAHLALRVIVQVAQLLQRAVHLARLLAAATAVRLARPVLAPQPYTQASPYGIGCSRSIGRFGMSLS